MDAEPCPHSQESGNADISRNRAPRYRPALDGLRGISILAVLAFHQQIGQGPDWAPGGFIGVDVFFVLSGYLITTILIREYSATQRITLRNFWARRARRLLPALAVLTGVASVWSVVFANTQQRATLRASMLATVLYVQNYWQFVGSGIRSSPIGPTWSLSLEEQFYVVWPLLLIVALRLTHGNPTKVFRITATLCCLAAVTTSLVFRFSTWEHAYYSLESRCVAILVGAALALWLRERIATQTDRTARIVARIGALAIVGLVPIVLVVHHSDAWLFYGGFAGVAVGTSTIVWASVQHQPSQLQRALSWKPLVVLGRVSYGAYLFHVPIYYMINYAHTGLHSYDLVVIRLAATLLVAGLSYQFVEQPIRTGERFASAGTHTRTQVIAVIAAMSAIFLIATSGGSKPDQSTLQAISYYNRASLGFRGTPRLLIAGEGIVARIDQATNGWHRNRQLNTATSYTFGCTLFRGDIVMNGAVKPSYDCSARDRDQSKTALVGFSPDLTIVVSDQGELFDRSLLGREIPMSSHTFEAYFVGQLERLRRTYTSRGGRFAITTIPCGVSTTSPIDTLRSDGSRRANANRLITNWVARSTSKVQLIDLATFLCPNGATRRTGTTLPDGYLLTPSGNQQVLDWLVHEAGTVRRQAALPQQQD